MSETIRTLEDAVGKVVKCRDGKLRRLKEILKDGFVTYEYWDCHQALTNQKTAKAAVIGGTVVEKGE